MTHTMGATDQEAHTLVGTSTNQSPTNARPKFSRPRVPSHQIENNANINADEEQCQERVAQAKELGRQEGRKAISDELIVVKDELKLRQQEKVFLGGELFKIRERIDQVELELRQVKTQRQDLISDLTAERRRYKLQADKHSAEYALLTKEKSEAIAEAIKHEKKCHTLEKKLLDAELRASDWQHEYDESRKKEEILKGHNAHFEGRNKYLSLQCAALAVTMNELNGTNTYLHEQAEVVTNAASGIADDLLLLTNAQTFDLPRIQSVERVGGVKAAEAIEIVEAVETVEAVEGSGVRHEPSVLPPIECYGQADSATSQIEDAFGQIARYIDDVIRPSDVVPAVGNPEELQWTQSKMHTMVDFCPLDYKVLSPRMVTTPHREKSRHGQISTRFLMLIHSIVLFSLLLSTLWVFHYGLLARKERIMLHAAGSLGEQAGNYILDQYQKNETLAWLTPQRLVYLSTKGDGIGLGTHFGEYGVMR